MVFFSIHLPFWFTFSAQYSRRTDAHMAKVRGGKKINEKKEIERKSKEG